MYFGSVRFFKNLILLCVIILIAVPTVLAICFGTAPEREAKKVAELTAEVKQLQQQVEKLEENRDAEQLVVPPQEDIPNAPVIEEPDAEQPDVEQQPEFPGGMQALMKYLRDNMNYPGVCKKNKIQGKTYVHFIVGSDGVIRDVEVQRSSGDVYLDKEALRVVKSMPKWNPGRQDGKAVAVEFTLPIVFRLK